MTDITTANAGKHPLVVLRERLESRRKEIKDALPSDVSVDNFVRAVTTSAQLNPELQAVTWQSLWDACIRACRIGLLPDGLEAAIVPYKTRAQFIPMVQGVLRNARRSGQIKWIKAEVVREGEEFDHVITQNGEIFRHVPGDNFNAPIVKAYALAITKDDAFYSAVMSKAEVDKHRALSRAGREDSPWNQWYEAMAVKTAIHKLGKLLPSVRDAIKDDDTIAPTVVSAPLPADPPVGDTSAGDVPEGAGEGEGSPPETPPGDPVLPLGALSEPAIGVAYQEGAEAKAKGSQRRAIPGAYREPARVREQIAWLAGFDGKPIPTFEPEDRGTE